MSKQNILKLFPYFDTKNKFIAFINFKAGSSSVVNTLGDRIITLRSHGLEKYRDKVYSYTDDEIKNIFKFTIVRNPWDRVVSAFFFLRDHIKYKEIIIEKSVGFKEFIMNKLATLDLTQELESVSEIETILQNHFSFQYVRVNLVDFVGRLENIDDDWGFICNKIGCNVLLEHHNKSIHDSYEKYYDNDTMDMVSNIYKKDVEILKYSF